MILRVSWRSLASLAGVSTIIGALLLEIGLKPYVSYPPGYADTLLWWRFLPFAYALYAVTRAAISRRSLCDYWMVYASLAASSGWVAAFLLVTVLQHNGVFPHLTLPDATLVFCASVVWALCGALWAAVIRVRQGIESRGRP